MHLTRQAILEQMDRADLLKLLGATARQNYVLDGLWFRELEQAQGHQSALAVDEAVWLALGRHEARRFRSVLGLEVVERLEDVARVILLTPFMGDLGTTAEIADGRLYLQVDHCRPQLARQRLGLGEFACRGVETNYLGTFLAELNPLLRFACVFCPPGPHPAHAWCRWEIWLDR